MPQYLVNRFAEEIAQGETELALICGAELLRSTQAARRAGLGLDWNEDPDGEPTRIGDPRLGFSAEEARHELRAAIHFYPLLENAIRAGLKRDVDRHMKAMGRLFERLAAVAKDNPLATRRRGYSAAELSTISDTITGSASLSAAVECQRHHRPGGCRVADVGRQGARMGYPAGPLGVPARLRRRHRHLDRVGALTPR
jgi:hypothetical protein